MTLVLFLVVFKGKAGAETATEAAENYLKFTLNRDATGVINCMFPTSMHTDVDNVCKAKMGMSFSNYLDSILDETEFNAEVRNIHSEVRRTYDEDELRKLEKEFQLNFGSDIHLEEAQRIKVIFEVKGTFEGDLYEDWEEENNSVTVYKYEGKWYCYD